MFPFEKATIKESLYNSEAKRSSVFYCALSEAITADTQALTTVMVMPLYLATHIAWKMLAFASVLNCVWFILFLSFLVSM